MRHKPNFLIYPLFLPHLKQRRTTLVLNFGFLFDLAICAFVAIQVFYFIKNAVEDEGLSFIAFLNGKSQ